MATIVQMAFSIHIFENENLILVEISIKKFTRNPINKKQLLTSVILTNDGLVY